MMGKHISSCVNNKWAYPNHREWFGEYGHVLDGNIVWKKEGHIVEIFNILPETKIIGLVENRNEHIYVNGITWTYTFETYVKYVWYHTEGYSSVLQ